MLNYDQWITKTVLFYEGSKHTAEIWNDLPQKPEASNVENIHKHLHTAGMCGQGWRTL